MEGKEVKEEDYENDDDPTRYLKIFFHLAALIPFLYLYILKKPPTFRHATGGLPAKRRLRNEPRNSILMTPHYPNLGSASDWLKICFIQSEALPRSEQ